jgi:putative ABC transport system permease protein
MLVISEIALTLPLLSGAGLMLRSFERIRAVDPGWVPDHLLSMRIALPDALYPKAELRAAFLRQLLENLNSTPGIKMAAVTDRLPLSGETNWWRINVVGRPLLDSAHARSVEGRQVSATYFRTMGIPLLRGREFSDDDVARGRHVTVINQEMADQFWPGTDPLGQRVVSAYAPAASNEVIGVIGNIKDSSLDSQSLPEMYSPYGWWNTMTLVLRGGVDSAALISAVRSQVARLDKEVPVYDVAPVSDLISHSVARQRFELLLLEAFSSLALLLAAVGVYGVFAFTVARRSNEIGLRIALGAHPRGVLRLVMSQGMRLIITGVLIGLVASLALTRAMAGLLYRISSMDPLTLVSASTALLAAGALAGWFPARRVLSVDPMIALRCE